MTNQNRTYQIVALMLALAYGVLIAWLSLTDHPPQPPGPLGWDKLQHFVGYSLLSLLLCLGLGRWWFGWRCLLLAIVCAFCYGAVMEFFQGIFSQHRTAQWGDILANGAGVLIGAVLFRIWRYRNADGR